MYELLGTLGMPRRSNLTTGVGDFELFMLTVVKYFFILRAIVKDLLLDWDY